MPAVIFPLRTRVTTSRVRAEVAVVGLDRRRGKGVDGDQGRPRLPHDFRLRVRALRWCSSALQVVLGMTISGTRI